MLIELKIEKKDENRNNPFKNINCEYILNNPKYYDINVKKYIIKDILIIEKNEIFELFLLDIIEINFGITQHQENNLNSAGFQNMQSIKMNSKSSNYWISSLNININLLQVKHQNYKFLEYRGIIGTHTGSSYFIKELKKGGLFISGGTDNKIIKYSSFYNKEELEIKGCLGFFDYSEEKKIVVFTEKDLFIREYHSNASFLRNNIEDIKIENIVYLGSKTIFICSDKSILLLTDFLNSIVQTKKVSIINNKYFGGIKINDKIVAFVSNKLLLKGENQIIFYNVNTKKVTKDKKLKGYSYTMSKNNIEIMTIPKKYNKNEDNRLLFCGCKKYALKDKNGILLVILEMNKKNINKIYEKFYNTNNFEVYCFCPIYNFNNKVILEENKTEKNQEETEYLLVGGLDLDKSEGLIKLYKVNQQLKLEFISDINIEKYNKEDNSNIFKGFKGAITCITQSKDSGDILISCLDGNIYLFSEFFINNIKNMDLINNIFK